MRNVLILAIAQFFGAIGQVSLVVLAGLIGAMLAPDVRFATLPVTFGVVGMATATVPAALAMKRLGRRRVFIFGALLASGGSLLAAAAVTGGSFWWYCLGNLVIASNVAFTAQYRFAAAESVAPAYVSRVVAWVMLGTIFAAAIGPRLVVAVRGWSGPDYVASLLLLAVFYFLSAVTLTRFENPVIREDLDGDHGRPLRVIARQPAFLLAVLGAAIGYGVMALIMTATPLSMHVVDGHSVEETAWVIQGHVLAMYAPSLVSGWLVARLGALRMLAAGALLLAGCVAVAVSGQQVMHYGAALVALGAGWNLVFVATTTLLTTTYRPAERFPVQALNEFCIFGITAAASLLAGVLITTAGWKLMNLLAIAPLLVLLVLATAARRNNA